ncbi:hypothetical protein BDV97DRAFT_52144 [Delphinella strobiligena]|nr:hypothetical protein BDV97DRAFT_52144 [Delphinella strobiligena]
MPRVHNGWSENWYGGNGMGTGEDRVTRGECLGDLGRGWPRKSDGQGHQMRPTGAPGRWRTGSPYGGGGWGVPPPSGHPYEVLSTWDPTRCTPLARETQEPPTCLLLEVRGGFVLGGAVELLKSHAKNAPRARSYGARTAARSATPHASSEGIWRGGCSAPPVPVGSEGSLNGLVGGFKQRGWRPREHPSASPTVGRAL